MSVARHHAEWLSLVEVSGPFLSMPVLLRAFPDGLDLRSDASEHRVRLHAAHEEWLDNQGGLAPDPAIHRAWVRFAIREALEIEDALVVEGQSIPASCAVTVGEHQERLQPDLVLVDPPGRESAGAPRLLITIVPTGQKLDSPMGGVRWKASPATRMMTLLQGAATPGSRAARLGLVTNGEQWMLVHAAPGETTTYASFYSSLFFDEPLTLRAFASLLGSRRFFGVPDADALEKLFLESGANQQELTDQLGAQVRRAVEVLIQTIDRIDRDRGRELLRGVDEKVLYEAAVTVMMRLVFLFAAEERGLLLLGDPLFDQHYAVSTLRDQLQTVADQHGEEVLKRRHDAWSRLLATFRAVFGGVRHESMRLPAYGGSLFDPDRFPFLEGRAQGTSWQLTPASPLAIDNLTVLDLLSSLQILRVKVPGGGPAEARRLSFRALDVEQIGHVYEGLLDHTAKRARSPVVSLKGSKNLEPEIEVSRLEEIARRGEEGLVEFLAEQTGRSKKALQKAIKYEVDTDGRRRFMRVCDNQDGLYRRIEPWAGLVREDVHGDPVVFDEGAVYVTDGAERRATGTHYTPKSLTEPIVHYTLEPLVYAGPVEGWAKEKWALRSAKEILALRVCDLAMGSGAFLVQACRYLSERVVEAWEAAEAGAGGKLVITPEGDLGTGSPTERALPRDLDERLALARRYVADRCLYGVDKNPMAVEMAKLSLWLVTLQKDRPFTFVDHALRCGDSLLGLTEPAQIERFHLDPERGKRLHNTNQGWTSGFGDALKRALELRKQIEQTDVSSAKDILDKHRLLHEAEMALADARLIADCVIGAALAAGAVQRTVDGLLVGISYTVADALQYSGTHPDGAAKRALVGAEARRLLDQNRFAHNAERRCFHWVLEFPEVLAVDGNTGFDAIVGNPPFMGGLKLETAFGRDYRALLVDHIGRGEVGVRGTGDLCAYFFLRATALLRREGGAGLVATNTISQGDTRRLGLDQLSANGCSIYRAVSSDPWPGEANLEVAHVWLRRGEWRGSFYLDGRPSRGIGSKLDELGHVNGNPHRLVANSNRAFQGSNLLGLGFTMAPDEARSLIARQPRYADVLFPYLNGEDLNTSPDQSASRWAINFRDWPLDRTTAPESYDGPVASDYPDCLAIVRQRVKPERDAMIGRNPMATRRGRQWWRYAGDAKNLYASIVAMDRVLVVGQTAKYQSFVPVSGGQIFDQKLVIFNLPVDALGLLQSSFHTQWAISYGSSLETRPVYTPSDCFDTFPFPLDMEPLREISAQYVEHRSNMARDRKEGLTKLYNRFHSPAEMSNDVVRMRRLHELIDIAVAATYGWTDLVLDHGFVETNLGVRFSISHAARRATLDRLLDLNHQRYAEELAQGLHGEKAPNRQSKRTATTKAAAAASPAQASLFGDDMISESAVAKSRKR